MKISRTRGKNAELGAAKYWGCRRAHFERHDLTGHPVLSIEVKTRSRPIAAIEKWYSQARAAVEEGRVPAVHYHVQGREYADDLVLIRASDLRDLIGRGGEM